MAASPDPASEEIAVIGHRWSKDVHEVKDFLARARLPYRWYDIEQTTRAAELLERHAPDAERFPVVILADGTVLIAPGERELAEHVGLETEPEHSFYDLIIVGGGPAGLSAAVYAASEGLRTVVVERELTGGQAGHSARIENYLGFPEGVRGNDLARRGTEQAERFGADVLVTRGAEAIRAHGPYRIVRLDDGSELAAHSILIATGVALRWLEAPGCTDLIGSGIYYGATSAEASAFAGQDVFLLGGGNSAGQAALELSEHARHVTMLVLEDALEQTMSRYLIERIRATSNVGVCTHHTVTSAGGNGQLEEIEVEDVSNGARSRLPANGLFVFIGTTPLTGWLANSVELDEAGFVRAGADLRRNGRRPADWPLDRDPLFLETSMPGVFVAGDARHGSVKRLATASGEGAAAVTMIHQYLAER